MSRYFKCRFCDWKVLRHRTNKDGTKGTNWFKIEMHCIMEHDEELRKHKLLHYTEEGGDETTG